MHAMKKPTTGMKSQTNASTASTSAAGTWSSDSHVNAYSPASTDVTKFATMYAEATSRALAAVRSNLGRSSSGMKPRTHRYVGAASISRYSTRIDDSTNAASAPRTERPNVVAYVAIVDAVGPPDRLMMAAP